MTIIEAINKIDSLKPNTYTQADKIRWLSILDGRVKEEVIDTHEGAEDVTFDGYNDGTLGTELLIPHPYDELYSLWLEAQIDYANNEYGRYNNSISMFNATYSAFERWYNRTHMPIGTKISFFANSKKKQVRFTCPNINCGATVVKGEMAFCPMCGNALPNEDPLNQDA